MQEAYSSPEEPKMQLSSWRPGLCHWGSLQRKHLSYSAWEGTVSPFSKNLGAPALSGLRPSSFGLSGLASSPQCWCRSDITASHDLTWGPIRSAEDELPCMDVEAPADRESSSMLSLRSHCRPNRIFIGDVKRLEPMTMTILWQCLFTDAHAQNGCRMASYAPVIQSSCATAMASAIPVEESNHFC